MHIKLVKEYSAIDFSYFWANLLGAKAAWLRCPACCYVRRDSGLKYVDDAMHRVVSAASQHLGFLRQFFD